MKQITGILFAAAISLLLITAGCTQGKPLPGQQNAPSSQQSGSAVEQNNQAASSGLQSSEKAESSGESGSNSSIGEDVTPYQLLNLMAGNTEALSFDYTLRLHETGDHETGSFYKSGELAAAVFTTQDSAGKPIAVREVERDGRVFYVMDAGKKTVSYPAPADDMLFYQMLKVTAAASAQQTEKDGYWVYEYTVPFEQDSAITFTYRFYMQTNVLKKLEVCVDETLQKTYEFSLFKQEIADKAVFTLPGNYTRTDYDYAMSTGNIPPWWDDDGLGDI